MNIKAFLLQRLARKKYHNKFKPATFKKILGVRPEKIGDTICMIQLIRELKKAFPSARIDIYAITYNKFIIEHGQHIAQV